MTCSASNVTYGQILELIRQDKFQIQKDDEVQVREKNDDGSFDHLWLLSPTFDDFVTEFNCLFRGSKNIYTLWYDENNNKFYSNTFHFIECSDWHGIHEGINLEINLPLKWSERRLILDVINRTNVYGCDSELYTNFKITEFQIFMFVKTKLGHTLVPELAKIIVDQLFCDNIQVEFEKSLLDLDKLYHETLDFLSGV